MKTRIASLLTLASLILAFAFTASAPAAPHEANTPATPAASALPAPTTATPAEPHPQIREALAALRRARSTWSTPHMTSVATAWKRFVRPMKQSINWKFV